MKRILTIPLLFLYLVAASGVLIQLHYCGAHLDSWNLYAHNDGCGSGMCGNEQEKKGSCCSDEVIAAKISNDQDVKSAITFSLQPVFLPQETVTYNNYIHPSLTAFQKLTYYANAPPGSWQYIPLYKLHSNFTYYG